MTPDIGERVARLEARMEAERHHAVDAFLNISARFDKAEQDRREIADALVKSNRESIETTRALTDQITDLRLILIRNRGYIAGLMTAAGLGGGIISAAGQFFLQWRMK